MSTLALTLKQYRFERRMFWRNPSAAFFNFILPLLFLILIASVFGLKQKDLDVLVPGIAGLSILSTTFTALAYNVVFLREEGVLKRVRGTPLPPISLFGGIIASAVVNALVQVAIVIAIGHLAYGVSWPQNWIDLIVFTLLGVVALGSMGIALAHAIPNFDAAAAYVNAVFLPMMFISGTFYSTNHLPGVLAALASVLPLKHVIDGLHGAIVTGAGLSHYLQALVVLIAWSVGGVFLAVRYFRWE